MALQWTTGPDATESQREALSKAVAWLDGAKRSDTHQDKALKVILGARSGKPREALQTVIHELLALQRADGGWSQTVPELKSDAFATGQALYALSLAGLTAERPEIQRGIDFLVAAQKPEGSWPMTSRSTPDGSPGGAKLLTPITCAASSWATLGLVRLVPRDKPVSKAGAARNTRKVPTEVAGTDNGGKLLVRGRLAYLIKPSYKTRSPLPCQRCVSRYSNKRQARGECQMQRKSCKTTCLVGWVVGYPRFLRARRRVRGSRR